MYEVRAKGLKELENLGVLYPQVVEKHLRHAMTQSTNLVENNVRPLVPVGVSSRLRNSIGSQVIQQGPASFIGKVGSSISEPYPMVMELGREPGAGVPPENLERWVRLKLRVPAKDVKRVAWLVARSISQFGMDGKEFMKRGWEISKEQVDRFFLDAIERTLKEILHVR